MPLLLRCPNCGASLLDEPLERLAECLVCGTPLDAPAEPSTPIHGPTLTTTKA